MKIRIYYGNGTYSMRPDTPFGLILFQYLNDLFVIAKIAKQNPYTQSRGQSHLWFVCKAICNFYVSLSTILRRHNRYCWRTSSWANACNCNRLQSYILQQRHNILLCKKHSIVNCIAQHVSCLCLPLRICQKLSQGFLQSVCKVHNVNHTGMWLCKLCQQCLGLTVAAILKAQLVAHLDNWIINKWGKLSRMSQFSFQIALISEFLRVYCSF